jgi:hypothetical protein
VVEMVDMRAVGDTDRRAAWRGGVENGVRGNQGSTVEVSMISFLFFFFFLETTSLLVESPTILASNLHY